MTPKFMIGDYVRWNGTPAPDAPEGSVLYGHVFGVDPQARDDLVHITTDLTRSVGYNSGTYGDYAKNWERVSDARTQDQDDADYYAAITA